MTKNEMIKAIEELQELETFMEEIKAEAENINNLHSSCVFSRSLHKSVFSFLKALISSILTSISLIRFLLDVSIHSK